MIQDFFFQVNESQLSLRKWPGKDRTSDSVRLNDLDLDVRFVTVELVLSISEPLSLRLACLACHQILEATPLHLEGLVVLYNPLPPVLITRCYIPVFIYNTLGYVI